MAGYYTPPKYAQTKPYKARRRRLGKVVSGLKPRIPRPRQVGGGIAAPGPITIPKRGFKAPNTTANTKTRKKAKYRPRRRY